MKLNLSKKQLLVLVVLVIIIISFFYFLKKFKKESVNQIKQKLDNPTVPNLPFNKNLNINSSTTGTFIDSDHDGLANKKEEELGTNPNKFDTDNDNLTDGYEVDYYHTDPLNPDTDGDGYKDGDEVMRGYDPTKKDDQMPAGPPPGSAGWKP